MRIGDTIIAVESCSSTSDLAREAATGGAEEGMVFVSREQKQGRGTRGKSWFSAKDKGLYASIILRPPESHLSLVPLLAGLAVRDAVKEETQVDVELRWPNDIVWKSCKLGGILCESEFMGNELRFLIVGIGLNISHKKVDFPPHIRNLATSLKIICGKAPQTPLLLSALCRALNGWYSSFLEGKNEGIISSFQESSSIPQGARVSLFSSGQEVEGSYRGLDPRGGLVLEESGKRRSFLAAEVKGINIVNRGG